jgi:HEAT repeat protein
VLDPDPQVRRRLARLLPEVPGLDAVPWLVLLTRDEDAEVRLTALTLLATTGDPTLLDEVGELVRGDADPRVQRLAERLGPGLK